MTEESKRALRLRLAEQKKDPAFKEAQRQGFLRSNKTGSLTPARVAALHKMREKAFTPAARAKAVQSMPPGLYKNLGKRAAERQAKPWLLVSPKNVVFRFKNLSQFIRDNKAMFDEADMVWVRPPKGGGGQTCRASYGLASLSPRRKHPHGSWKGWRWLSIEERLNGWIGLDPDGTTKPAN